MNNYIKSGFSKIKAEDELVEKTKEYLLNNGQIHNFEKSKIIPLQKLSVKFVAIACSLLILCGLSITGYAYYKNPVAYLSLDINPSVELGVNAFDTVVSVEGCNEDGKTILEGQNVINSNVEDAVAALVQSASDNGFIAQDGSTIVSVTSETNNDTIAQELIDAAEQGVNNAIKKTGNTAVVYKDKMALDRRDEAKKLGISPGKLNLIEKLQAQDPTATVDEYKDAKVTDIMKDIIAAKKDNKVADSSNGKGKSDKNQDTTDSVIDENQNTTDSVINEGVDDSLTSIEKAVEQSNKNKSNKNNKTKDSSNSDEDITDSIINEDITDSTAEEVTTSIKGENSQKTEKATKQSNTNKSNIKSNKEGAATVDSIVTVTNTKKNSNNNAKANANS